VDYRFGSRRGGDQDAAEINRGITQFGVASDQDIHILGPPLVDLRPIDGDIARGFNADSYAVTLYGDNRYANVFADDDLFADATGKNEHGMSLRGLWNIRELR
jgi:hypothetical protein